MVNRFATLVVVVIIALLALFAFQNFYKPTQFQPTQSEAEQSQERSVVTLSAFPKATSWQVGNTSVTFHHNVSIENGKRVDFVTLRNNGSSTALSLLVFMPKKLAASAAQISRSGNPRILKDDPILLYDNVQLRTQEEGGVALLVDASRWQEEEIPGVIIVPLYRFRVTDEVVALADVFASHAAALDALSTEGAFDVEFRINSILAQVAGTRDALLDIEAYLSSLESSPTPRSTLYTVSLEPLSTKVSVFSPFNSVSFTVCRLQNCGDPGADFQYYRPLVRVEGSAAPYASFAYTDVPGDRTKIKVDVQVDVSHLRIAGGNLYTEDGGKLQRVTGTVIVAYTDNLNAEARTTLTITVEPTDKPVRVTPSTLPRGKGGSIVFITNDFPFELDEVTSDCFASFISVPGTSPLGARASAIYFTEQAASAGRSTCKFYQNGLPLEGAEVKFQNAAPDGLSQLYPVVAEAASWQTCTENFCTCDATREALRSAADKVRADSQKFYGPRYPFTSFVENFVFNLANFDESCNFGVEFSPTAKPKPGAIQVIAMKVNLNNLGVTASAFHDPQAFIAGALGSGEEEVPTNREIRVAAASQWPCRDSGGLPSPQPEHECSRELRSPPFITVAARSR